MFVIYPENPSDWVHAMFIMSYYRDLHCELYSDGEEASSTYMVVDDTPPGFEWPEGMHTKAAENLRYAEMAFQMNWHQASNKFRCIHCDALPEPLQEEICGHLTFNKTINPAF